MTLVVVVWVNLPTWERCWDTDKEIKNNIKMFAFENGRYQSIYGLTPPTQVTPIPYPHTVIE